MKNHLVAIIVPDPETLVPWAKANGISTTDMPSLCKNPRVKKLIFDEMVQLGHSAKVSCCSSLVWHELVSQTCRIAPPLPVCEAVLLRT